MHGVKYDSTSFAAFVDKKRIYKTAHSNIYFSYQNGEYFLTIVPTTADNPKPVTEKQLGEIAAALAEYKTVVEFQKAALNLASLA